MKPPVPQVQTTSWTIIGLTVIGYSCAILFVNTVLFQGRTSEFLGAVYAATGFLVQGSLVAGLFDLAIVAAVIFGFGRLAPTDVGWSVSSLKWALAATLSLWIAIQFLAAVVASFAGSIAWHDAWSHRGTAFVVGGLLGQLLGNSLVEETVFRGFLLPQLYFKFERPYSRRTSLVLALIASQLLFAISHLPNLYLVKEVTGSELLLSQVGLFVAGLVLAGVYLMSGNLFFVVGLHALGNNPTLLIQVSERVVYGIMAGFMLFAIVAWSAVRFYRRGTDS